MGRFNDLDLNLECPYKACQTDTTDGGYSQTLAQMNEVRMNDKVKMTMR